MKLSCLPLSYYAHFLDGTMTVGQWAREAASIGLDGIDLSVQLFECLEPTYLDLLHKEIEAAGLRVAMVATYPDFTHPDPTERKRQIELQRAYIEAAGGLGAQLVRLTAGQAHPGLNEQDGIRWALQGMTACEEAGRKAGVRLVLENHGKPGCWQYTDFDQPTHIFLALAEGIRPTTIGINFDTANPIAYGDDPLPILQQVIDQVVSIHAADTDRRGELSPVVLGTGLVPFGEIFSYLTRTSFDGWVCIEEASHSGPAGVAHAVSFVRQAWKEAQDSRPKLAGLS